VALHAAADHGALEHVASGEQGGGAVALVIVGSWYPALSGLSSRPGWVRSSALDRRLRVDREHDRVLGRGQIEADDVREFGGELASIERLKVRMRCGWRSCAAQMPTALLSKAASPRVQCAADRVYLENTVRSWKTPLIGSISQYSMKAL
jgi:hypothetical protein